jgi:hypothetical protein
MTRWDDPEVLMGAAMYMRRFRHEVQAEHPDGNIPWVHSKATAGFKAATRFREPETKNQKP